MGNENRQLPIEEKDNLDIILKKILRYDFYINSTNSKASLVIAWNGLVVGTVLLKYNEIISLYQNLYFAYAVKILLALIGFASVISIALVFQVVYPFLVPNQKKNAIQSLFFFGSVAKLSFEEYIERESNATYHSALSDLTEQAYVLATGLNKKMISLQRSIKAINYQLVFILFLLFLKGVIDYF